MDRSPLNILAFARVLPLAGGFGGVSQVPLSSENTDTDVYETSAFELCWLELFVQ